MIRAWGQRKSVGLELCGNHHRATHRLGKARRLVSSERCDCNHRLNQHTQRVLPCRQRFPACPRRAAISRENQAILWRAAYLVRIGRGWGCFQSGSSPPAG